MTRTPSRRLLAIALASALAPAPVLIAGAQSLQPPAATPAPAATPVPASDNPTTTPAATAAVPFIARDIRVDGLQRISAGTVFTYLPIERGDQITQQRAGDAIRALYETGFFSEISIGRQGDILVISVTERPAINKLTVSGNTDIETEDLLKGLADVGLREGNTFDRLALDRVVQEMTRLYNDRGKYSVQITPLASPLPRNRVNLSIIIEEGEAAKIQHINLLGNETFTDEQILESWESSETNWLSWYKRDDQYSRAKLAGDLESLNSYYLDRGYVDFAVNSPQVSISRDREDIFITAGITEGEQYTVSGVEVVGDTILPKERIEALVLAQPDQIFSRRLLELSSNAITATLGNVGYAFAAVNPQLDVNREDQTVAIDLQVVPGPRVNVRRIVFNGNTRTADEVLRRQVRQFEGTWYSQAAIDRSKIRLQSLGYFDSVEIEVQPVPGSNDQVDVAINVVERSSGSFVFGLGFSQLAGLSTQIQVTQNNFLGTGNRIQVGVQRNDYLQRYDFSFTNPYFTDNGVALGYNLWYREFDNSDFNTARYSSTSGAAQLTLGVPITETDSISMLMGIDSQQILPFNSTPQQIIDYIDAVGQRTFHAWRGKIGWARNTLNSALTPSRGTYQRISVEAALPGSTVQYYKLNYEISTYWSLSRHFVLNARVELGYGDSYGDPTIRDLCFTAPTLANPNPPQTINCTPQSSDYIKTVVADGLPFFENFYAGGVRSVRGFRANTLGPRAQPFDQPIGGSLKTIGSLEVFFPTLLDTNAARASAFIDVGNVYQDIDTFDANALRASAGVALLWRSPMGPITISYAYPLRKEPGDEAERLQFTFGGQF